MHWRGYIIVTLIIAALAGLFFVSPFLQDIFFLITRDVNNFASGNMGITMVFFVILAAISAMVSPFSSVPTVPIAVSLWEWEVATVLLLLGWIIGGGIAYAIGYAAGNPILRRFIHEEKIKRYEKYFSERMTFPAALLVRLSLPAEIGYAFGVMRYRFSFYFLATVIAEIPVAIVAVRAADALVTLNPFAFLGWLLALLALICVSYFFFRLKKSRYKNCARVSSHVTISR